MRSRLYNTIETYRDWSRSHVDKSSRLVYINLKFIPRVLMPTYLLGQKQKYRITLELEVLEDFDPHQIDWEKTLDIQGAEKVNAYIENLSCPDRW